MCGRAVCLAKFRELLIMKTLLIAGVAGFLTVVPGTAIAAVESTPTNGAMVDLAFASPSAIAASSDSPTIKYWEIAGAGCLTFMEITNFNRGMEFLDFVNNESAIFINEKNYVQKFEEYLSDIKNPKWAKIANEGRELSMKKYNNDEGVKSLIELMEEYV